MAEEQKRTISWSEWSFVTKSEGTIFFFKILLIYITEKRRKERLRGSTSRGCSSQREREQQAPDTGLNPTTLVS